MESNKESNIERFFFTLRLPCPVPNCGFSVKSFVCNHCGGHLHINSKGWIRCPDCQSKFHLTEAKWRCCEHQDFEPPSKAKLLVGFASLSQIDSDIIKNFLAGIVNVIGANLDRDFDGPFRIRSEDLYGTGKFRFKSDSAIQRAARKLKTTFPSADTTAIGGFELFVSNQVSGSAKRIFQKARSWYKSDQPTENWSFDDGFDIRHSQKRSLGGGGGRQGLYFTERAEHSHNYAHKLSSGKQQMFLAEEYI